MAMRFMVNEKVIKMVALFALPSILYCGKQISPAFASTVLASDVDIAAGDVAATALQNVLIIGRMARGEPVLDMPSAQTLIADTQMALSVTKVIYDRKISDLLKESQNLRLAVESLKTHFAYANKVSDGDMLSGLIIDGERTIQEIENTKSALQSAASNLGKIEVGLKAVKVVGYGLAVIDTGIKGIDTLKTLDSNASGFEKAQKIAEFSVSTLSTGLPIYAEVVGKSFPAIAATQAFADISKWYADILGDSVNQNVGDRIATLYNDINNTNLRIQNRIMARYKAGNPPTDEEALEIARTEYEKTRQFIAMMKADSGWLDWIFGLKAVNETAFKNANNIIDAIEDKSLEERVVKYNLSIRDKYNAYSEYSETVREVTKAVERISQNGADVKVPGQPTPQPCSTASCKSDPPKPVPPQTPANTTLYFGARTAIGNIGGDIYNSDTGITIENQPDVTGSKAVYNNGQTITMTGYRSANDKVTITGTTHIESGYQYTAWGEWNGSWPEVDSSTGKTYQMDRGYFVIGRPTTSAEMAALRGTATYSGTLVGDVSNFGSSNVRVGAITGTVGLNMDFDARSIAGRFNLFDGGTLWAAPQLSSSTVSPDLNGSVVGFNGSLSGNGSGGAWGVFYGPKATEAGGAFYFVRNAGDSKDGVAEGIFLTKKH